MLAIRYKCRCMEADVEIEVSSRPDGGDLMLWMNVVQHTIALDHATRSPRCQATAMEFAKISVDEDAPGIGIKRRLSS